MVSCNCSKAAELDPGVLGFFFLGKDKALNENQPAEPQRAAVVFAPCTGGCSASVFICRKERFPGPSEPSGEAVS